MAETKSEVIRALQGELLAALKRYKQFHKAASRDLLPEGNVGAFAVLVALQAKPGVNGQALASHLGLDKGSVSRYLQILEEAGLALRSPVPDDGRSSVWSLTELAETRLQASRESHIDSWQTKLGAWDEARLVELLALLRDLNDTLESS